MKGHFRKLPGGMLVPDDDETAERLQKLPAGTSLLMTFKQIRNYLFLKKAMALIKLAFEFHSETLDKGVTYRGMLVKPNIDRFREDMTILAGYYTATFCITGDVKLRAQSWSYANMEEHEFERLYSALIDVVLSKVYQGRHSEAQLRKMVDTVLGFA